MENSERPRAPELGTFEAARLIGVTPPTVRSLAERGELDGWKIGRNYKFAKSSIDEFLSRAARPLAA
jgi:excisionase family DNA binding protein